MWRPTVGLIAIVVLAACSGSGDADPTTSEAPATTQPAVQTTLRAYWPMDDVGGDLVRDASGNGNDGTRGPAIEATGEAFAFSEVTSEPDPGRLVEVPDADAFDIVDGEVAITVHIRTTSAGEHNVVQHGQNDQAAFWKVELNANGDTPGIPHCTFVGDLDSAAIGGDRRINDGEWHTVSCRHTATTVAIVVDGDSLTKEKITGPIVNEQPLSIGGKSNCDGDRVECDYYVGELAEIRIEAVSAD